MSTMTNPFNSRPAPRWLTAPRPVSQVRIAGLWPTLQPHSKAMTYVKNVLDTLVDLNQNGRADGISVDMERRAYQLLSRAMDDSSYYPAITPSGEGSLNLYWKAGIRSIQIELDPDDSYFYRATGGDGEVIGELLGQGMPSLELLKSHLVNLTKHVNDVNPDWRALFTR